MNPMDIPSTVSDGLTAGQMLRAAREAKGLHLAVLSVTLKVPVRQLEALESDNYAAFKGTTFLRAMAQSVCRHLGQDPAPVLAALPHSDSPLSVQPRAIDLRVPSQPRARRRFALKGMSRQVLLLAVLMLAGTAALIWWPVSPASTTVTDEQAVPVPILVPEQSASEAQAEPVASPVLVASASASAVAPPVPVPVPTPAPTPVASAASPKVQPVVQAPSADEGLLIAMAADAWVEIRDGRGQMVVRRQVKAGETLKQDVSPPLFVYIGRANAAQVSWRGKLLDLKPHTQNNEARLQVKP